MFTNIIPIVFVRSFAGVEGYGGHIPCHIIAHCQDIGRTSFAINRFGIDHAEVGRTSFHAKKATRQLTHLSYQKEGWRYHANVIRFSTKYDAHNK